MGGVQRAQSRRFFVKGGTHTTAAGSPSKVALISQRLSANHEQARNSHAKFQPSMDFSVKSRQDAA